jgi:hypothetical protein
VAPENESDELMYQPTDSEVIVFDQDHPLQVATVPIVGDCQEVNPLMFGYVLMIGFWNAGIRELLDIVADVPPSPEAMDLQ